MDTFDLKTLEGVQQYVDSTLLAGIRAAFATRGGLAPFGIAFGEVEQGVRLKAPRPMPVGDVGHGVRDTKARLRRLVKVSEARGCILATVATVERKGSSRTDELVVVQLEHTEFGDHVWTAPVNRGRLGDFTGPTLVAAATYNLNATRFMPPRYMH